jgi:carboxylesterase
VDPLGAQYLYDQLGSEAKVLHWLHSSDHIIQMDREREQVFEWVGSFF